MIGLAQGTVPRSTAAGIATFAGVSFVIPPPSSLLLSPVSSRQAHYLPSSTGQVLRAGTASVANALSPWTGFAVLCGSAEVLIAIAAWRLRRADA